MKKIVDCSAFVCRNCGAAPPDGVCAGAGWHCSGCHQQLLAKYRKSFARYRLGLVTAARRAGFRDVSPRQHGERWGERLPALKLPEGDPAARIASLQSSWAKFREPLAK